MRLLLLLATGFALVACTSPDPSSSGDAHGMAAAPDSSYRHTVLRSPEWTPRAVADLPDRGTLFAFTGATPVRRGPYTWHDVHISETHALRAIATGEMTIEAPDGTPIRLQYDHHVEHPDGNWTWVGRPAGAQPGTEAIITFGDKAVFGTIPHAGGKPLRIGSNHGRTWVMETDMKALVALAARGGIAPREPDFVVPPALAGARDRALHVAAAQPQQRTAAGAVPESATVDVVIGYTTTFASRLGGTSQAITRLTFLTDVTNQAFTNSQVVARVRMVGTVALDYPDATNNQATLHALTGCTDTPTGADCGSTPIPAALQPLVALRDGMRADLMSLVRNFHEPENGGCGIAWLVGGGMDSIGQDDAPYGVSVVSDSNGRGENAFPDNGYVCRDETFAHEIGHNMGSAHDRDAAAGDDGVLSDDERGAKWYSLGYKNASFFTVMAYGDAGLVGYRVFSNPRITSCGSQACGVTNEADNARSLGETAPLIASFAQSVAGLRTRSDFDADHRSDLLWRNTKTGANTVWLSANSATQRAVTTVANFAWSIAGSGDFNGDGASDILWRNATTGQNQVWWSGSSTTSVALANVPSTWHIVGIGDFNGDDVDDLLWRNPTTGQNAVWRSGNHTTQQPMTTVASAAWSIMGVGDFDHDGVDDVLWRNSSSGANAIWRSANAATQQSITAVANQAWTVAGVGDFDGDGNADILWRNAAAAANAIWRSGNAAQSQWLASVPSPWTIAGVADYNGDGSVDIFWRNMTTFAATIWRSGNHVTSTAVTPVPNPAWIVARS